MQTSSSGTKSVFTLIETFATPRKYSSTSKKRNQGNADATFSNSNTDILPPFLQKAPYQLFFNSITNRSRASSSNIKVR